MRVMTPVRVMSWNLWWQFGPWEERQAGIHQVVAEIAPDILCVQESWGERSPSGQVRSQIGELAQTLGFSFVGPTALRFHQRPEREVDLAFSNGIISRWPLLDINVTRLPKADGTPSYRMAVIATVDAPGGPLRVVTAHIAHVGEDDADRLAQAQRLSELSDLGESGPNTILAGDLNATPDSPELRLLAGCGLTDAWEAGEGDGWTWAESNPHARNARVPNRRLDYILTGSGLTATAAGLAGTQPIDGIVPSDHYAVWADLSTPTSPSPSQISAGGDN